ncbi:MAG TPA: cytochrome c, partial [Pirellulaceae bacterium]
LTRVQSQDVADILAAMFGTPDEPFLPGGTDTGIEDLIRLDNLQLAAGKVESTAEGSRGLYRQHCVHCHGTSGDGHGPTAPFLNPYPRDYRRGTYKFKSTPIGIRPTHDDLKRILKNGIAGTAMPSFHLLPDLEIEALVDYVKYLSIRGEVERRLWQELAMELDEGDRLVTDDLGDLKEFLIDDVLAEVVGKWKNAEAGITPVPKRFSANDEEMLVSIRKGKELYYGAVANCVKCHGESQLGDGQTTDYDDWTKEFYDWAKPKGTKEYREAYAEYVGLTHMAPRNILPRNLRQGVYRGGRRPVDLYWRIHNGIEGGPMPAASMLPEGAEPGTPGLTEEDIWHLVNYVMSLSYESTSSHGAHEPVYSRPRM